MINNEFIKQKINSGDIEYDFCDNYILCNKRDKYEGNIIKITNNKKIIEDINAKYLLLEYNITNMDTLYLTYDNLNPSIEFLEISYTPTPVDVNNEILKQFVRLIEQSRNIIFFNLNNKLKNLKVSLLYANTNATYLPSSLINIELNNSDKCNNIKLQIQNLPNKIEILLIKNFTLNKMFKASLTLNVKNF